MLFAGKWMKLEIIMFSKKSQTKKDNITSSFSFLESGPYKMNDWSSKWGLFQGRS
jgi:hypothetical protein